MQTGGQQAANDVLGETAEGKRRRVTQACDNCSKRRARCDGAAVCGRCTEKGLVCIYSRQMKKRGPTRGAAVSVRERISRLEKLLDSSAAQNLDEATRNEVARSLRELGSNTGSHEDDEEEDYGGSTYSPDANQAMYAPRAEHGRRSGVGVAMSQQSSASAGNFAIPWLGSASPAAAAPSDESNTFVAPALSFHSSSLTPVNPGPSFLLGPVGNGLPVFMSPSLYQSLVRTFLSVMWPTLPILHPSSLLNNPSRYPSAIILIVLAAGIRFSKDPELTAFLGNQARNTLADQLYEKAWDTIKTLFMEYTKQPTMWDIILLIHLEVYLGVCSGQVGAALRWVEFMLIAIREIELDENEDLNTDAGIFAEESRRAFWSLFLIDRGMTFGSSIRTFAIPRERYMLVKFPISDDVFAGERPYNPAEHRSATLSLFSNDLSSYPLFVPTFGQFAKLIVLFNIFAQIIELHRVPGQFLDDSKHDPIQHQLDAFYECLPSQEKAEFLLDLETPLDSEPVERRILPTYILLVYYALTAMLHSPAGVRELYTDDTWLASEAFLKCAEAAGMVTQCLSSLSPANVELIPFWSMFPLIRTTQIHVLLVKRLAGPFAEEMRKDMKLKVQLHIQAFHALGARVRYAPFVAQLLTLLLEKSEQMASGQVNTTNLLGPFAANLPLIFGFSSWESAMKIMGQRFGKESFFVQMVLYFREMLAE